MPPGRKTKPAPLRELGSPEVARKILDEQTRQAVLPPRHPLHASRIPAGAVPAGGGLAVLVLACFFFQHSKATPVQPVGPFLLPRKFLLPLRKCQLRAPNRGPWIPFLPQTV